jgi:hypothetical protein
VQRSCYLLLAFSLWSSCEAPTADAVPVNETDGVETNANKHDSPLSAATATYEYAQNMIVDSTHRVEFTISRGWREELIRDMTQSFEENDSLAQQEIWIGELVEVELIDPNEGKYFSIVPLSVPQQRILATDTTFHIWQWNVKPLQTGSLPLIMRAFTTVNDEDYNIPVFDTRIDVTAKAKEVTPPGFNYLNMVYALLGVVLLSRIGLTIFRNRGKHAAKKIELPISLATDLADQIGDNKTLSVLEQLETYLRQRESRDLSDVLLLKASWLENRRKGNLNVINDDTESIENARINLAVLELIEALKDKS